MPFRYEAYNREGRRVAGVVDVESEEAAERSLWDADLSIVELKKVGKPFALHEQLPSLFGVRAQDVIAFSNQLAFLAEAGINIYQGLQIIRDQTAKPAFRTVIAQLVDDLTEGITFADACGRHPTVFPTMFVRLVKVGEQTGRVEVALRRAANYMERERAASSKIKAALGYPVFVLLVAGIAMYVLMAVALPNLIGLFKEFNAELPLSTRIVIAVVDFSGSYGQLIALAIIAGIVFLLFYSRTPEGGRRIDRLMVKTPIIGSLIIKLSLARIADTLGSLLSSGVPMTDTLDLLLETTGNVALREPLQQVRTDILSGSSLSQAMGRHNIFPAMMVNLTRVGEEAGTMETTFRTLAQMYNDEADQSIARVIGILEPGLIVLTGLSIGFVAITIISTIYSVLPAIK